MRMPLPRLRLKLCESVLGATAFPLSPRPDVLLNL